MKEVNILSIIEAFRSLDKSLFKQYTECHGITSGIKDYELVGLESLAQQLLSVSKDVSVLMHYYLGYSIPQIGKEFDLLRFGTDSIINIEIKTDCSLEKVLKQQQRNLYYLSFLGKELLIYTYLSDSKKLYKLVSGTEGCRLREVPVIELYKNCLNNKLNISKISISVLIPQIIWFPRSIPPKSLWEINIFLRFSKKILTMIS